MAVQVGRTVISFTIKYVQSERDKLKTDVAKVLDTKAKAIKPIGMIGKTPSNPPGQLEDIPPASLQMQATHYQGQGVPMNIDGYEGLGGIEFPEEDVQNDNGDEQNLMDQK